MKKKHERALIAEEIFSHASSNDIARRRLVAIAELEATQDEIAEARRRLAAAQRRERGLLAEVAELRALVQKR